MKNNTICICIMNYNCNENALKLFNVFSQYCNNVFITDSGSPVIEPIFIKTDRPFGNLDKANELFLGTSDTGCLYICSDVEISLTEAEKIVEALNNLSSDIGMYTPVVNGKSHTWLKASGNGLRDIPFCEGMIHYATRDVVEAIDTVYTMGNTYLGWGIDAWWAFVTIFKLNKRVVLDNDTSVYHPSFTSYNCSEMQKSGFDFVKSKEQDFKDYVKKVVGLDIDKR
jgi:hypothetical protein